MHDKIFVSFPYVQLSFDIFDYILNELKFEKQRKNLKFQRIHFNYHPPKIHSHMWTHREWNENCKKQKHTHTKCSIFVLFLNMWIFRGSQNHVVTKNIETNWVWDYSETEYIYIYIIATCLSYMRICNSNKIILSHL